MKDHTIECVETPDHIGEVNEMVCEGAEAELQPQIDIDRLYNILDEQEKNKELKQRFAQLAERILKNPTGPNHFFLVKEKDESITEGAD